MPRILVLRGVRRRIEYRIEEMPSIVRGNLDDSPYPDTKIPRAIFPDISGDYELHAAVIMLNLGEHEANRHYAAIVRIQQLDTYVLFYRPIGGTWTLKNMRPLKPVLDDALYMLDENKPIHRLIENLTGLKRKRPKRRHRRKTRRNKRKSKRTKSKRTKSKRRKKRKA